MYPNKMDKASLMGGGKPKATQSTSPIHPGMVSRTRDGATLTGITETSVRNAPDASGKTPMDPTT